MMRTFYILLIFIFSSCSPTWRRKLTIPRSDYTGTELQTDGFYYNKNFETFILYKNGVYLTKYSVSDVLSSVKEVLNFWQSSQLATNLTKNPTNWGVFQVRNNRLIIETWFRRTWGEPLQTAQIKGTIVNPTTLILNEFIFSPQRKFKSDTFYFYPMWLKPDNKNPFIQD